MNHAPFMKVATQLSPAEDFQLKQLIEMHKQGRLAEAETGYRQIIARHPTHANTLQLLGTLLGMQGKYGDAAAFMERSLTVQPNQTQVMVNLALSWRQQKHYEKARTLLEKCLKLQPSAQGAWLELGALETDQGNFQAAISHYQKLLQISPQHLEAMVRIGKIHLQVNRADIAETITRKALAHYPNDIRLHHCLSGALQLQGKWEEAEKLLLSTLAIAPNNAETHAQLGYLYLETRHYSKALEHSKRAIAMNPSHANAYTTCSAVLTVMGEINESKAMAQRALELDPRSVAALNNLGNALLMQGQKKDAEDCYRKAIELEPSYPHSYRNLSMLIRFTNHERDRTLIENMQALYNSPDADMKTRLYLGFALGKAFEDLGEPDIAFPYYAEGNALMAKNLAYDPARTRDYFHRIQSSFTAEFVKSCPKSTNPSRRPIFILGMPRSGTTLTEQILASHPDVFGGEELGYLGDSVQLAANEKYGADYPDYVTHITTEQLNAMAEEYLAKLDGLNNTARHVTDKMPANFRFIGMILLMFPQAKIIHCTRDAMDTCLSIFKQTFASAIDYAYDQESLADYYGHYQALMAHWHSIFPNQILDFSYEALIQEPEKKIPHLLDFCGLSWHDDCLKFHETKRTVRTASTSQVRQPLYRSSVDSWQAYEKHLQPLIQALNKPV